MKNIVIDIDGTICPVKQEGENYADLKPYPEIVAKLKEYREMGFRIILQTSRNMRTYNGDIEKIRSYTLPILIEWLQKNKIPYDDVIIGKPWCGTEGFYIDDKAIRPAEFANLSYKEIKKIIGIE